MARGRKRGIGRATGSAATTGVAVPIPSGATQVKIETVGAAFAGVGTSATVPAPTTSNSVAIAAGEPDENWDTEYPGDTHIYIYGNGAATAYTVSFYG